MVGRGSIDSVVSSRLLRDTVVMTIDLKRWTCLVTHKYHLVEWRMKSDMLMNAWICKWCGLRYYPGDVHFPKVGKVPNGKVLQDPIRYCRMDGDISVVKAWVLGDKNEHKANSS